MIEFVDEEVQWGFGDCFGELGVYVCLIDFVCVDSFQICQYFVVVCCLVGWFLVDLVCWCWFGD